MVPQIYAIKLFQRYKVKVLELTINIHL
jgi:hypothetical protein